MLGRVTAVTPFEGSVLSAAALGCAHLGALRAQSVLGVALPATVLVLNCMSLAGRGSSTISRRQEYMSPPRRAMGFSLKMSAMGLPWGLVVARPSCMCAMTHSPSTIVPVMAPLLQDSGCLSGRILAGKLPYFLQYMKPDAADYRGFLKFSAEAFLQQG